MASIKKYLYITIIITIIIGVTLAFIIYDINTNEELDKRIKEELTWYTPRELAQFDSNLTKKETVVLNEYTEGLYKNDNRKHENEILKEVSPTLYNKLINLFDRLKNKRESLSEKGRNFYISMCKEGHYLAKNRKKASNYKIIIKYIYILKRSFNKLPENVKDELTLAFPTIKVLTETDSYEAEFDNFMNNDEFVYSIMRILKVLQLLVLY
uniref:Exported protein n=1 Tax=Strongyloides venezuelensis TaxID=75913 RepID=A0A0K0FXE8_STRVS